MKKYNPQKIESNWQKIWEEQKIYKADPLPTSWDGAKKPKQYILIEFPYPSGSGLHVGHCRPYCALDAFARKKRMEGYNVLFPIGWDAFGLPTENFAIKNKIHPQEATKKNIANFKRQIKSLGLSFDWSREINTTDPEYYKWTQWIFLKLFEKGLAYQTEMPINWCPSCKIGLANEEVINGKCERCGAQTEKKIKKQWLLKITAYADKLIEGLKEVDYPERVKTQQINWIGKSEGATVKFQITNSKSQINSKFSPTAPVPATSRNPLKADKIQNSKIFLEVFTTRPDTLFGCTYLVVCPEHKIIASLLKAKNQKHALENHRESKVKSINQNSKIYNFKIENLDEVEKYLTEVKKKSDLERTDLAKEKTGIELKGIKAINPVNNKEIPIFVADYVLPHYGTGAIMAVPSHDKRDYDFAKYYGLPMLQVVLPQTSKSQIPKQLKEEPFEGEGVNVNSDFLNGLETKKAKEKITKWLEEKGIGKKAVNYKLRDWIFSRQHYWGEPIPLIFCPSCKKLVEKSKIKNQKSKIRKFTKGELLNPGWVPIPEKDLPVKLPYVEKYQPTKTGESPLTNISEWVNVKCPKCGHEAKRETDTMPNWAGSSWYYLAYIMRENPKSESQNSKQIQNSKFQIQKYVWDKEKIKYWMPVDFYNGGMEHTTLHLLYSRFWYKFLFDIGVVPQDEPYQKRTSHGIVLAEDGRKMSKSFGNVINPDDVVEKFGADTLRLYEMFMGPFEQTIAWNTDGLVGIKRFLQKIWQFFEKSQIPNYKSQTNSKLERLLHQTIKKVTEDIDNFKFNTAISQLMILLNEMEHWQNEGDATTCRFQKPTNVYTIFLKLLSPFAPHIAEELYQQVKNPAFAVEGTSAGKQNSKKFKSIFKEPWPKYDKKLIKEEKINLIIQINGKVRDQIEVDSDISEEKAKEIALSREKVIKWIKEKPLKKIVFIKNKLINIVV